MFILSFLSAAMESARGVEHPGQGAAGREPSEAVDQVVPQGR